MPNATITVDAALKERLADLASQTGQQVDEFVEALLRRIANADVRFDRGVPVFHDAPALQRYPSKTSTASPTASANSRGVVGLLDVNVGCVAGSGRVANGGLARAWWSTDSGDRNAPRWTSRLSVTSPRRDDRHGPRIRELPRLRRLYGNGRWRKMKGGARIRLKDGRVRLAELHWYEAHGIGKKEFKRKRYLD